MQLVGLSPKQVALISSKWPYFQVGVRMTAAFESYIEQTVIKLENQTLGRGRGELKTLFKNA